VKLEKVFLEVIKQVVSVAKNFVDGAKLLT